jgi:hypothetical protein
MAISRRRQVRDRAKNRCEYCHLPQDCTLLPHTIDHIRAKKHHGATALDNLCWACADCNAHKGPNAAGFDPATGDLVPLFNPRHDAWEEHFMWDGPVLYGKTAPARATIDVLQIDHPDRIEVRRVLMELDRFPLL